MHGDLPREVLDGFHAQLLHDLSSGAPRSLEDYVKLFPQHADRLRAEYMTLLEQAVAERARAMPASGSGASPGSEHPDSPSMQLVRELGAQQGQHGQYARHEEIARGGMGAIVEVWDEHMRRSLAMKVMLRTGARSEAMFIEEAQVTGRLDHPGIVPVHELGMGSDGRLYFTMRLVKGQTLKDVIDLIHAGDAEWTQTRVLDVLLKVCDAMAYAHSKRVVHRDLKPANVMVGRFGEVYVMDWGLARVLGTRDRHDLRLRAPRDPGASSIHTLREKDREETPDSPLLTMDGEVMGTPAYMSPEQAAGRVDELGPRSDVYAVGAMLYHVLTGRAPYTPSGGRASNRTILAMLLMGPPHPVQAQAPDAPAELVAICEKAMSRDPAQRYADMQEMAADLRAYVEHRVVHAYETGAMAESRKWLRRNPGLAAALGSVFALAIAVAVVEAKGRREADRERQIALDYAARVAVSADTAVIERLEREVEGLWPIHPRTIPALERWLAEARLTIEHARASTPVLAALRAQALPYTHEDASVDAEKDPLREKLRDVENRRAARLVEVDRHPPGSAKARRAQEGLDVIDQELAALKPRLDLRHTWRFSDPAVQQDHDSRARLAEGLERLTDPERGSLIEVERRLEHARTIVTRSIDDHRAAWDAACAAIANPRVCPAYRGLVLAPQVGLVPIGPDPESYFYEFAVPETGDLVQRGPDGKLVLTDTMAVVLVLLPGGKFTFGAQRKDRAALAYDELANEDESPVRTLELRPFFASKFEMTQAQWSRLGGGRPSNYDYYAMMKGPMLSDRHPVENVSWPEAVAMLARVDLLLPTEAQWEYFARAGTTTPWFTGDTPETLTGYGNLADKSALDLGEAFADGQPWNDVDDGWPYTAPVGTYLPNGFGLHDVCGNVAERCREGFGLYDAEFDPRDGFRDARGDSMRAYRGGHFGDEPADLRMAKRFFHARDFRWITTGVRPVRRIDD